ncbi:hypothetical protein FACS1894110_26220 [Spirochaetia bacterium]|nr:hypothetical protein FACS1894110_26220 [Spirochaetia bacterium]
MKKKSLVVGTIVLLLTAVVFLGCPTEATDPETVTNTVTEYVDGYQPPAGAVKAATFPALVGLLNAASEDTNGVTNIIYDATAAGISADLTIPSGKNVIFYGTAAWSTTQAGDILVAGGGTLTIAKPITVDSTKGIYAAPNGNVVVEKGGSLAYTAAATEIGDATEHATTHAVTAGTATIIGSTQVDVKEGGTLVLVTGDLVGPATTNKFTLTEAWAAAKSGNLAVTGTNAAVGVDSILALGLSNGGTRKLSISSTETTNSNAIATAITIPDTLTLTTTSTLAAVPGLTVNGSLTANSATFAALASLTVNGQLSSSSTSILIATATAATTIDVGPGASLALSGASSNLFAKIIRITAGPGAIVSFSSSAAVFADLVTLNIKDGANVTLGTGTSVTFKTTDGLTALTLGKNSILAVGPAAGGALVDTGTTGITLAQDTTISGIAIKGEGGLTVAPGKKLTLGTAAAITVQGGSQLKVSNGSSVAFGGSTNSVVLLGAAGGGGKLQLGSGDAGKNTIVQAASFADDNGTTTGTNVTLVTGTATSATLTITAGQSGQTAASGASVAPTANTDATITYGRAKDDENVTAIATAQEVVANAAQAAPLATGLGATVTIAGSIISVGANGAR